MANRKMYFKANETTKTNKVATRGTLNAFANDGSFLEMFKKKMEEKSTVSEPPDDNPKAGLNLAVQENDNGHGVAAPAMDIAGEAGMATTSSTTPVVQPPKKSSLLSLVGKRRGGKVLPTGMVKKAKRSKEDEPEACTDAWSQYMAEVKRYKEKSCEDEGKTRPLVK